METEIASTENMPTCVPHGEDALTGKADGVLLLKGTDVGAESTVDGASDDGLCWLFSEFSSGFPDLQTDKESKDYLAGQVDIIKDMFKQYI